jgi:hypothetical protein
LHRIIAQKRGAKRSRRGEIRGGEPRREWNFEDRGCEQREEEMERAVRSNGCASGARASNVCASGEGDLGAHGFYVIGSSVKLQGRSLRSHSAAFPFALSRSPDGSVRAIWTAHLMGGINKSQ